MQHHCISIGALSGAQFSRMLDYLEPFRNEPMTVAVMALAADRARLEVCS